MSFESYSNLLPKHYNSIFLEYLKLGQEPVTVRSECLYSIHLGQVAMALN